MQSQKETAVKTMCQRHRSVKLCVDLTTRTAAHCCQFSVSLHNECVLARVSSISCLFEYCFFYDTVVVVVVLLCRLA